jgi:hypothetical protein
MYFLIKVRMARGQRAVVRVEHVRPVDGEPRAEVIEEHELTDPERLPNRERGWIVAANPGPGEAIRFALPELDPVGPRGACYDWEVTLCDAWGPSSMPDPGVFSVSVPRQTEDDIADCPDASVAAPRAVKVGPRAFEFVPA